MSLYENRRREKFVKGFQRANAKIIKRKRKFFVTQRKERRIQQKEIRERLTENWESLRKTRRKSFN